MSARATMRVHLGAAAVISPSEAAAWLPCRDEVALAWLRDAGLITDHPMLGRVVVWRRVLEAIEGGAGPVERAPVRRKCTLPRHKLPRRGE